MSFFQNLFGKSSKAKSVESSNNDYGTAPIVEFINSISIWEREEKSIYSKEQLSKELVTQLLRDTLDGTYNKLVMELEIKGESTFIPQLNKTIEKKILYTMRYKMLFCRICIKNRMLVCLFYKTIYNLVDFCCFYRVELPPSLYKTLNIPLQLYDHYTAMAV